MPLRTDHLSAAAADLAPVLTTDVTATSVTLHCTFSPGSSSRRLTCHGDEATRRHPNHDTSAAGAQVRQSLPDPDGTWTVKLHVHRDGTWTATAASGDVSEIILRPVIFNEQPVPLPPVDSAAATELADLWNTHAGDYEESAPAGDPDLEELARALGQPVPPQLATLLRLVNGAGYAPGEGGGSPAREDSLTAGWSLLGTAEIAREHAMWSDLAAEGPYTDAAFDLGIPGALQPRLVHPGWIPFAHDHSGNHLAIDTVPGPNGTAGQILEFGPDLVDGPFLHADSLLDFLQGRRSPWPEDLRLDHRARPTDPRPLHVDDVPSSVQSLRLFGFSHIDGATLAQAPALKRIIIRDTGTVDLTGLQDLPLQELSLQDIADVDLSPLAGHPTLRTVTVSGIGELRGADTLVSLPRLESLSCPAEGTDVEELAAHPRLHRVSFTREMPLAEQVELCNRLRPAAPLTVHTASGSL